MQKQFPLIISLAVAVLLSAVFVSSHHLEWWFTPDQQGDYFLKHQRYQDAAKVYQDPLRQGIALYKAGQFKEAASTFLRVTGPEGAYNRGNALLLAGKYQDAIDSYRKALTQRPDWKDAEENLAIALVRKKRLETTGGDMTGGQIKPDDFTFDKNKNPSGEKTTEIAGGEPMSDSDLRAVWLRQVQTKPADFLRAKFAYQLQQQQEVKK